MKGSIGCLIAGIVIAAVVGLMSCGSGSSAGSGRTFPALAITSNPPPDGVQNAPYNGGAFAMTASGGKAPYGWSWSAAQGSALPSGLMLNSNRDGTGTITGSPDTIGSYDVVVQVADAQSPATTFNATYTINVAAPGPLTITSGAPPSGAVGQAYGGSHTVLGFPFTGFPLNASGGLPGYTWTWAAASGSSLPPGLRVEVLVFGGSTRCCVLVPVIDGTPTAAGSYDVVVTVTDSASPKNSISATYTIIIS